MRKEKTEAVKVDRRGFLKGAGLAIGSAGATAAVGSVDALAKTDNTQDVAAGYRETEHVRAYYKLAQF